MRLVFDGDRALARVSGLDRRGRREGVIVEVVSRAHESIVGRYFEEGGIGFVIPDNPKVQQEVLVTPGRNGAAKVGQFVEVKITHWPTPRFQPQGDIIEVVGNYMAPGMEIDVALRTYDIPHVWPEAVLKEAAKLKPEVEEKDKEKRIDLRHLPFVTIDGEDARDFDDAVYCEAKPGKLRLFSGGWKLYVAIADVSSYVKIGSALDNEAQVRGNSVYFPERVIPMLPEQLSNGLCSLNPKVDRLAMGVRDDPLENRRNDRLPVLRSGDPLSGAPDLQQGQHHPGNAEDQRSQGPAYRIRRCGAASQAAVCAVQGAAGRTSCAWRDRF
jgi:ribonuclease R